MASVLLCFLCFSSFLILPSSSSTSAHTITLSLTSTHSLNPSSSSWEYISHIVKSTLERAHHLKNPHKKPSSVLHSTEKTPLYPRGYGGYSVSLSFGSPPQSIPLLFDTGSSLVWVPCTANYSCLNCTFKGVDPTKIATFKPNLSTTTRIVGCRSPKCEWLNGFDVKAQCSGPSNTSFRARACSNYNLEYGIGSTHGYAITDNLDFPDQAVPGFFLGCSVSSSQQPQGIAGVGRGPTSLPNQLKLRKFSYCLLDHKFDDKPKSSDLILTGKHADAGAGVFSGVKYTRFHKNPEQFPYNVYYYVNLNKITVGKRTVKFPKKLLRPGPTGNGGVIVDSGTTYTLMDRAMYDPLVTELVAQTGRHYRRNKAAEAKTGFGLCYDDVSGSGQRNVSFFPRLAFHFMGGAKMELPVSNYFSYVVNDTSVLCLTIMSDSGLDSSVASLGPAMILGNYQQQNFYIEFDLGTQRFGFKKQKCG